MASAFGIYATIKFAKLLSTPFEDWEAFKLGLIDKNGKKIKSANTREEKKQFEPWLNLVRNLKRFISSIGGKAKIAGVATTLALIKESDPEIINDLINIIEEDISLESLVEEDFNTTIIPGNYLLSNHILNFDEEKKILKISVESILNSQRVIGVPVFRVKTNKGILFLTSKQITRI